MFDKKKYRERREQGLRGQEDLPAPTVTPSPGQHMVRTPKGFKMVNRSQARRKLVDRTATKKGFIYGIRIGSPTHERLVRAKKKFAKEHKGERIPTEEQRIHLENHPLRINPNKSNHQRMLERKEKRDADRAERASSSAATATA